MILVDKQHKFDGQWLGAVKGIDDLEIGAENFKTLQNMRPVANGLEGVAGYTKINTNVINATYLYMKNGHQLRTDRTVASYVLVQSGNVGGTASCVYQNRTAIPTAGQFTAIAVHTDATGYGTGRFSDWPGENVAYCNGVESCVWGGDEMRCAAFFTLWGLSVTSDAIALNDRALDYTDTIVLSDGNYWGKHLGGYGFTAGDTITVSGAETEGNDGTYEILSIWDGPGTTISIASGSFVGTDAAGASAVTVAAPAETSYGNPIDWTEAANNSLTTVGNVIPIGTGVDSYTVLMLHADDQTDESQTITDSSASGHTVTANTGGSNAQIDTFMTKFGKGSIKFDGTGDYLWFAASPDVYMGTGNFTIEWWMYGVKTDFGMFQQYTDDNNRVYLMYNNASGLFEFRVISDESIKCSLQVACEPFGDEKWHHIALIRGWYGDNEVVALTIDGNMYGDSSFVAANAWPDLSPAPFEIGRHTPGDTPSYYTGWIDEFRISKGTARWISDFTPPVRPYTTIQQRKWLAMSTRPLKGVTYDVEEVNATSSTTTCRVWTGREFTSTTVTDGTRPAAISLAQDGSMTFTSTVNIAKPFYFEGLYLYAYLFELSAGSAEIKQITLNADFQDVVDIWDGVYRQPIAFEFWDDSEGRYNDFTDVVNYVSDVGGYPIGAVLSAMTSSDWIEVMFDERMSAISIGMLGALTSVADAEIVLSYWNGYEWVTADLLSDGTTTSSNRRAFSQTGVLSWYPPGEYEEAKKTNFGVTGHAYKIAITGGPLTDLNDTVPGDHVTIDVVYGIPAQQTIRPFSFPSVYKNRPLLCGYTEGNQGTRIDYGLSNAADVWNGYETSMGGLQSIFLSGNGKLTSGGQLYNRFGSSVYTFWIGLMTSETHILNGDGPEDFKTYPMSKNIGNPAPLSLCFMEMGYEMGEETVRNIAGWVSFSGPMIFDGAIMAPIKGIDKYFDPDDSAYITKAYIHLTFSFYDAQRFTWNILFPSGSGATACNKWVAFAFLEKKWFEIVPSVYPQGAVVTRDAYGVQEIYGLFNDGYMRRLSYGTAWDSTAIDHVIETGDFIPSGNIWDISFIRYLKFIGKKITEAVDLAILHYKNSIATAPTVTLDDVTFVAAADTMASAAGNFKTNGFRQRQKFAITGSTSNNTSFTISSISADGKTLTVASGVTDEAAGQICVFTVSADMVVDLDAGSNRLTRNTQGVALEGWCHRFKFSASSSTEKKGFLPVAWGYQADVSRRKDTKE